MLNQAVKIAAAGARDVYGKPSYGPDVTVAARVSGLSNRLLRDADAKTDSVGAVIHMDGYVSVNTYSRVTILERSLWANTGLWLSPNFWTEGQVIHPVIVNIAYLTDEDGSTYATRVEC